MSLLKIMGLLTIIYSVNSNAQTPPLSNVSVTVPYDQLQAMQQQQNSGAGCMQNMLQQVNEGQTSAYELQQQETNALMGISEKYLEHARTCDNEIYKHLDAYRESKLEHEKNQNMLALKIKRQELEYRKAVHAVERQCQENSTTEWTTFKEGMSSGIENNPVNLIGKNQRLNNMRPLFYDNCMAQTTTVTQVQDLSDEMRLNIEEIYAGFENSVDTLKSVTQRLRQNQDMAIKQCLQGREQLEYQEAMIRNQNAAAQAHLKKQNLLGLLGAAYSCFDGPSNPSRPNDTTSSRAPSNSL